MPLKSNERFIKLLKNELQRILPDWRMVRGYFDLTLTGKSQARVLGKYLQSQVEAPQNVLFVTSRLERGIDTAKDHRSIIKDNISITSGRKICRTDSFEQIACLTSKFPIVFSRIENLTVFLWNCLPGVIAND